MSRIWLLPNAAGTAGPLIAPTKALINAPGLRVNTLPVNDSIYPFNATDDKFLETHCRVRIWRVDFEYELRCDTPGAEYTAIGSISIRFANPAADEIECLVQAFTNYTADPASIADFETVIPDGPDPTFTRGNIIGQFFVTTNTPPSGPDLIPRYRYGVQAQCWQPSLFTMAGASGAALLGFQPAGYYPPTISFDAFMAAFWDVPTSYEVAFVDDVSLVSASLMVTPVEWWEYRKANGTDPIWNANTGAMLRSPITQEF